LQAKELIKQLVPIVVHVLSQNAKQGAIELIDQLLFLLDQISKEQALDLASKY
jgi:hypothetical protein